MQRRALIVDDELVICDLIGKVLNAAGMEALTLTRSTEAPVLLDGGKFDVVFLDLHMASPDGIELARLMRSSRFNRMTSIVLISDDQRPSAVSIGFAAGANFFIYKPIDTNRLRKLVYATQGNMEHERRRTRRVPFHSKVLLKIGKEEFEGETIDISMCGLLVKAPRTVPLGSSVLVSLLSQRMLPLVGWGSVVRLVSADQMSIHLGQLPFSESQNLQEFLLPMIATELPGEPSIAAG
jgi:CheY-like chemotaxis protein